MSVYVCVSVCLGVHPQPDCTTNANDKAAWLAHSHCVPFSKPPESTMPQQPTPLKAGTTSRDVDNDVIQWAKLRVVCLVPQSTGADQQAREAKPRFDLCISSALAPSPPTVRNRERECVCVCAFVVVLLLPLLLLGHSFVMLHNYICFLRSCRWLGQWRIETPCT